MTDDLRTSWTSGRVVPGLFVMEFGTDGIGRIAAAAGAEFVVLDMEHSGWTAETIKRLVATTRPTGVVPIVRVPAIESWFVGQALDAGARGIMAPTVSSAEQAAHLVQLAKYPPVGRRGAAFGYAHDDYRPGNIAAGMRAANEATILVVQIETRAGLDAVDEIAAVPGIDVVWVGHNDLTASMGIAGQFDHPDYRAALDTVVAAAARHAKACGINVGNRETALAMAGVGFRVISFSDIALMRDGLRDSVAALRADGRG